MIQISTDEGPADGLGARCPTIGQHGCCFDDDFMMYEFKITKCLVSQPHLWRSCPFVHPGEPVHRRHPSLYQGDLCPAVKQGKICPSGPERCTYAHSAFEAWLHPEKYKTIMCRKGGNCNRDICFFAPSTKELRVPSKPRSMPMPDASAEAVAAYSALITGGTSQAAEAPVASLQVPSDSPLGVPLSLPLSESGGTAGATSMGPSVSLSGPRLNMPAPDKQMHSVPMTLEGSLASVTLAQPCQQLISTQQPQMLQHQAVVPGHQQLRVTGQQLVLPGQQQLQALCQQAMLPGQQLQASGQQLQASGQQLFLPGQQQQPSTPSQQVVLLGQQMFQAPGQQTMLPGQQQLQASGQQDMLSGQQQLQAPGQQIILPGQQQLPVQGQQVMLPGQHQLQVPAQQLMLPGQQQLQVQGQQIVMPGQQLQGPGQQVMLSTQQAATPCQQGNIRPLLPTGIPVVGNSTTKAPDSNDSFSGIESGTGPGISAAARWPFAAAQQDPFLALASPAVTAPTATAVAGASNLRRLQLQAAMQGLHFPATAPPAASCVAAANGSGSSAHAAQLAATDLLMPFSNMQQQLVPSAAAGIAHVVPVQQQAATSSAIHSLGLSTAGSSVARSSASSGSAGVSDAGRTALVRDLAVVNHLLSGLSVGPLAQPVVSTATQQHQQQAQLFHHQHQQLDDSAMNLCTASMAMHPSSYVSLQAGVPPANTWVVKSAPGDTMYWQQTVPVSTAVRDSGSALHGCVEHPVARRNHHQAYSTDWCVSGYGI